MRKEKSVIAAVQMASGPNVEANLLEAQRLIEDAVTRGAQLVVLPENFALMGKNDLDQLDIVEEDGKGPIQSFLAEMARKYGIWLVGGTLPLAVPRTRKVRSACLIFDDQGRRQGLYQKLHLFDADLPQAGEQYRESALFEPGQHPLVVDSPFGRLGIAVCYDLRFPELFRYLSATGVDLICLPASFTALTGQAHWEILIRARAIENLCYMVAAAQGGYHISGRQTHGHSLIVDPWGRILAEAISGSAQITATLDPDHLAACRQYLPALQHRRFQIQQQTTS